jgi:DtxR family Mn-dependent transcriptional regulator
MTEEIRPTPTVEDYLQLIHRMARDGHKVIATRLAEVMDVSMPTVTLTLKRMVRDGYIVLDEHKEIELTSTGHNAAESVIRRHMLTEWLLMRMLNVPWSEVHNEADQIEHTISDRVQTQLEDNLDNPTTCPHGNPLPGNEQLVDHFTPLTGMKYGASGIIRRVHENAEDNPEMLRFLELNGLVPGAPVEVLEVLSFNQTITLRVRDRQLTVGWPVARYVFVETL